MNRMFYVNFRHYYLLFIHGCVSCSKKVVDFNLLPVLLRIFSTTVRKIHSQPFLTHVHSSSFITHGCSLTVNDH
jgi:hypothetical protein